LLYSLREEERRGFGVEGSTGMVMIFGDFEGYTVGMSGFGGFEMRGRMWR